MKLLATAVQMTAGAVLSLFSVKLLATAVQMMAGAVPFLFSVKLLAKADDSWSSFLFSGTPVICGTTSLHISGAYNYTTDGQI